MRLQAAANSANTVPCVDAYTGRLAFRGQFSLYDDVKRDSDTSERRVISVAPDTRLPDRKVVKVPGGARFIIGHGNVDYWKGRPIRVGYVAHEATYLARLSTLGQACTNAGVDVWMGRNWVKDAVYSAQDSALAPQFSIYMAMSELVRVPNIIQFEQSTLVVRSVHPGAAGILIAACDELEAPAKEQATLRTGTYDPVTDTTTYVGNSVNVLRVRWQSLFAYTNGLAPKFGPGDIQLVIPSTSDGVKAGARVDLSDGVWQIQSTNRLDDAWLCRATRL